MERATRDRLGSADLFLDSLHIKSRGRRATLDRPAPAAGRVRNDLAPNLTLVQRPPGALTAPARAVRMRDIAQMERVAASIRALGFCDLVLIDGQDGILDGVARVEAAKLVGLSVIPCIVAGHLTPSEQRALRLALNRLQERGGWDLDELKLEFEGFALEDGALDVMGFTQCEIDQVLLDDEPEAVEPGPLTPSANAAGGAARGCVRAR